MAKTFISFFTFFCFIFCESIFSQDIIIPDKPAQNCKECDTLQLGKDRHSVLFVNIGSRKLPIEKAGNNGDMFREWKELEANFGNEIDLKYMNGYGIVVLGDSKFMDFRDTDRYFNDIYYWDGKDPKSVKKLNKYSYLVEQVGSITGRKVFSSYRKQFEVDSLFFENIIKNNTPSRALIENLKYCDEFREKGMEYFPYHFFDLEGIRKVEISSDSLFEKNRFRISFTHQQLIDTISSYKEGEEKEHIDKVFEYKNGIFVNKRNINYAYKGDTLISYVNHDDYKSVTVKALKNNMFLTVYGMGISPKMKNVDKSFYKIEEDSDDGLTSTSKDGYKTYYSNTKWELPLTVEGDGSFEFALRRGKDGKPFLKFDKFFNDKPLPVLEIFYALDKGKIITAKVKNNLKNRTFDLYYRYTYY